MADAKRGDDEDLTSRIAMRFADEARDLSKLSRAELEAEIETLHKRLIRQQLLVEDTLDVHHTSEFDPFYRRIAQLTPDTLLIINKATQLVSYCNRETILGYPPDVFIRNFADCSGSHVHPDDMDAFIAHCEVLRHMQEDVIEESDFRLLDAEGRWRHVRIRDMVFSHDATGEAVHVLCHIRDVTEEDAMQAQLARSMQYEREILDHIRHGFLLMEPDGTLVKTNRMWWELSQRMNERDISGVQNLYELVVSERAEQLPKDIARVLQGETITLDIFYAEYWYHIEYNPVYDADGQVVQVVQSLTDITERKQAQLRAEAREEQQRRLLDALPIGVAILDAASLYMLYRNPLMRRMTPSGVAGDAAFFSWFDMLKPEDREDVTQKLAAVRDGESMGPVVYELAPHNGKRLLWRMISIPIEFGGQNAILTVAEDVTEAMKQEERRREALLHRARVYLIAEFIKDASHEFKTPLSAIHTALYMLRRLNEDNEGATRYLDRIEAHAHYINLLVEGLLTMSKLDAGDELQFDLCNINNLVEHAVSSQSFLAQEKGVTVQTEYADDLPKTMGDGHYIVMAIKHLIDNAITHTDAGGNVLVKTKLDDDEIQVIVADTGTGMTQETQERAFERFYRADKAHSTRGFGLGLPIVLRVMEEHGGVVALKSELGLGTTVKLTFPLRVL